MDTWETIVSRRDVREFSGREIGDEDLDRILEAGRRAPSSMNWQPWDFVVVTGREELTRLSATGAYMKHVPGAAAAIVLVAPVARDDMHRDWAQFDLGQAAMSMELAAAALGIGSGHASITDQGGARELLGLPADRFAPYLLVLGYPKDRPLAPIRRPDRRPFAEVVHRGRW
ncbi:nitroreductase family protein [Bailinhaonella thermotolerans]|uniref:Nitroreductase n=1 Tax=Bailinhaonella thermotolerans TaxID=1070861 RepID=A0A3A4ATQ7_9ACTN|nr:nitroreductase family protein [Bailinhaonella thermotolerans]RJL24808.1 nitroreductase [Bailinhaonella thermotolerans]